MILVKQNTQQFAPVGSPIGSRLLAVQLVCTRWQSIGSRLLVVQQVRNLIAERSGSGPVRPILRDLIQKEPGQVGNPNLNPNPSPSPSPARHRRRPAAASGSARAHASASIVPSFSRAKTPSTQRARPCSQFSLFIHHKLPSHGQCGTKCFKLPLVPFWL